MLLNEFIFDLQRFASYTREVNAFYSIYADSNKIYVKTTSTYVSNITCKGFTVYPVCRTDKSTFTELWGYMSYAKP